MTDKIIIKPGNIIDHGWEFIVVISGYRHTVQLTHEFWIKMTHGDISPMNLVSLSMNYVRQRHALDILPESFDLEGLENLVVDFVRNVRALSHAEAAGNPR